jgi:hypothetical protein
MVSKFSSELVGINKVRVFHFKIEAKPPLKKLRIFPCQNMGEYLERIQISKKWLPTELI